MNLEITDRVILDDFRKEDDSIRTHYLKVACLLTIIFFPVGSIMDHFVYDDIFWPLFYARLLLSGSVCVLYFFTFLDIGKKNIKPLGLFWGVSTNITISWMIFYSEGASSPYYAGLNLIILAAAVLLPWSLFETTFFCATTGVLYLLACFGHTPDLSDLLNQSNFYSSLFFLSITSIICCTASYFSSKARFHDFYLRKELDLRNQKLEELDRLKSQFFANVSHELRTPLTLIISPIENLLRQRAQIPDKVHETLLLVMQNGLRLMKLINELLEVMRLEEGRVKIVKKPVNISSFVPGIVDSVRHLGRAKNIAIRTAGQNSPLIVLADPNRLEKVILNLLSNAIKFTDQGGNIIINWAEAGESALIEVADTGVGISEDELPRIFDRFHQVDGGSTRKYQGIGIGLALAKELIEEHEGTLTAKSQIGKGTTFTINLPKAPKSAAETESQAEPMTEKEIPESIEEPIAQVFQTANHTFSTTNIEDYDLPEVGKGDITLLVVDDEPDMRRFIVSITSKNYRILQAATGERGLKLAKEKKPNLIILDWMLPGKDGLQICQELRSHPEYNDIKIILLTARMDEASKIQALEHGADDFLTKPFSTVELETRIGTQLRTQALQSDLHVRNQELESTLHKLKETEAQLVQSEKISALGNLAAGLLHEINNPLNFTLTALQLGREDIPDDNEDLLETFHDIEDGMKRIRNIISDLRTFAYPETQGKKESFKLQEIVDSALRLTAHELKSLVVTQDIEDGLAIWGSKTQLTHVIMNLFVNAAKAVRETAEKRAPEIRLTAKKENERIKIQVWDNGTGIDPQVQGKIFDPFFTTRDVGEGMGLGLSICHTIVLNHEGKIHVASEPGEWTEMTIDIPVQQEHTEYFEEEFAEFEEKS